MTIGATFGISYSYEELETPFFIQQGPFAGPPTSMKLVGDGVSPTWSVGARCQLTETTMLGAAYTSADHFGLNGGHGCDCLWLGHHADQQPLQYVDHHLLAGDGRHRSQAGHAAPAAGSLDVVWVDWADAFKDINIELNDSSNPIFTHYLGPVFNQSIPLNWWDSVSVRTGYEWFYSDARVIRFGCIYTSGTLPSSTLTPWIPATLENAFTFGSGTTLADTWHLDLAYQYSFGPQRTVRTHALVGGDFSSSTIDAQAHWFGIGLTHSFWFQKPFVSGTIRQETCVPKRVKGGTRMLLTLSYWPNQGRNWRASRTEPKPQLTDEQWLLIADLCPVRRMKKVGGRPPVPPRPCLEGILWVLTSGARWKD